MGIDVEMMVRTAEPMSDDDLEAVNLAFAEGFGAAYRGDNFTRNKYEGDGCIIEMRSMDRYYGVAYERGPWPRIRAQGDWLAIRFGETAEVRYGGDYADGWDGLTPWPEVRAECEAHWRQVGHHPYREWHGGCDCDHCQTITWPPPAVTDREETP